MSISVNGQSCVPPGFRFHPTEEELLNYYLRKKVASQQIDLDVIRDVDLNKLEPWDIQEKCKIGSGPQNDWYFFSHKDKKYPTGTRTNRATAAGFWKATGRDKPVLSSRSSSSRVIGMRKTLVFYKGRAPNGRKTDWIMHEFRLQNNDHAHAPPQAQEEGWVVCRAFQKPIPNQRPFFPISYATPAGGGYHDYHHQLPPNARLYVVDGDHHGHFLGGYSAHHPSEPEAAAAAANNSFFPPLKLYSDGCYLLESKTKQLLSSSSSSIPQLESPTTTAIAAACAAAQQRRRRSYGGAAAAAQNELIHGGQDEDAAGAIDWSFLDTLLSTPPIDPSPALFLQ